MDKPIIADNKPIKVQLKKKGVATDSENIIVANQEGQDPEKIKSKYKFEYVNGSLEFTFPKKENITGILYQQGIREHVCDILEGGDEAFRQRERKYSLI